MNQTAKPVAESNLSDDAFYQYGNALDLHPVYAAMERARELAEANGTEPVDVVWDPTWPELEVDDEEYWNDLTTANWATLSRWYAMSLAAAQECKILHIKVRDGLETVTIITPSDMATPEIGINRGVCH